MRFIFFLALMACPLLGCVSTETSLKEVKLKPAGEYKISSLLNIDAARKMTERMLLKCFDKGGGYGVVIGNVISKNPGVSFWLERNSAQFSRYVVYNPLGVLLVIEIGAHSDSSDITTYAGNMFWKSHAENALHWYSSNEPEC